MYLYSVYDKVSEQYAPPFVSSTDKAAVRMFDSMLKGGKITYADDLVLYRFADFDAEHCQITKSYLPVSLAVEYESFIGASDDKAVSE